HVDRTPGAHVIVPLRSGRQVPPQTLVDAATLAAHYSRKRGATAAEVVYAPRKQVRKRRGAPPGRVEVSRGRTLRLRFEPARLERLLRTAATAE
ncbi:MAG: NFACT RNA binding domain-containing protein, partial [Planctomycetota bacterium]